MMVAKCNEYSFEVRIRQLRRQKLDVYKARKMPAFDLAGIADLMIACGYWLVSEMIVPIHEELLLLYLVALTSVILAASFARPKMQWKNITPLPVG